MLGEAPYSYDGRSLSGKRSLWLAEMVLKGVIITGVFVVSVLDPPFVVIGEAAAAVVLLVGFSI